MKRGWKMRAKMDHLRYHEFQLKLKEMAQQRDQAEKQERKLQEKFDEKIFKSVKKLSNDVSPFDSLRERRLSSYNSL